MGQRWWVTTLGTGSQSPTRARAHVSTVVRLGDQLILFDPGEGTQRQAILADVGLHRVTGICVTHFHGDHCLGLPGVIQHRSLYNSTHEQPKPQLPICFPADGLRYFDRLANCSIYHNASDTVALPVTGNGSVTTFGQLEVAAAVLDHRVTTYGYRLTEPDRIRFDPRLLHEAGLSGPAVGRLETDGAIVHNGRTIRRADVSETVPGRSVAFVMDTQPCPGAEELAEGADILICESTYAAEHATLARRYKHMTSVEAGQLAANASVGQLILTHFSSRYRDAQRLADEAGRHHNNVIAAKDLQKIEI